jgi:hypothetical protein
MRPPRTVASLMLAVMLPQLTGCCAFHPTPLRSLPGTPNAAESLEKVHVKRTRGRSVEMSGVWLQSDTLRGTALFGSRQVPMEIPVQDVREIGHRELHWRDTIALAGVLCLGVAALMSSLHAEPVTVNFPEIF